MKQRKRKTYARGTTTRGVGVGLDQVDVDSDDSLGALLSIVGDDVSLIENLESSSVDGCYKHKS